MKEEDIYDSFEKFAKTHMNDPAWSYYQAGFSFASKKYAKRIEDLQDIIDRLTLDIAFLQNKK
jgi:hypothetical protein